jgi:hypothetical protein
MPFSSHEEPSMRKFLGLMLPLLSLVLWGCSHTVVVPVPPRVDLHSYGTLGLVEFASNSNPAISAQTTREFESRVQSAQPGTRIVDLGNRDALLASVGSRQFDQSTLRKIGAKYGVDAIFVGNLTYSEPKTDFKLVTDPSKLEGGVRVEVRGDIDFKLIETQSGASVWSSSAWERRSLGRINLSAEQGVSGSMRGGNPREEMVTALVYNLTEDFRPSTVRQQVK